MIQNYAEYEMTEKERVLFLGGGYLAAAGIVFLFPLRVLYGRKANA